MSKPHRSSTTSIKADQSALFRPPQPQDINHLQLSTLLGNPHDRAAPQVTEPFWQQYPVYPAQQGYYYRSCDLYSNNPLYLAYLPEMDSTPIVIGYKSRYSGSGDKTVKPHNERPRIPRDFVKVIVGETEVGTIPLRALIRFSRYAKETFPKPLPGKTSDDSATSAKSDKQSQTPDAGARDKSAEGDVVGDLDLEAKLRIDSAGPTPTKAELPAPEQKYFQVYNDNVDVQPTVASVKYLLQWMHDNKQTRNNEPLLPVTPAPLHMVKMDVLVDTYAAVLAFNLTPFPHNLRHEILARLSSTPINVEDFAYISYRLPLSDPIMTRLFTSHFEHNDAKAYAEGATDAISSFVTEYDGENPEEPFFKRFNTIQRSRDYKQRQAKRDQKKEERIDSLRGSFEKFAGVHKPTIEKPAATPAQQAAETSASKSVPPPAEQSVDDESGTKQQKSRHRPRRAQQQKGEANAVDN